MIDKKTTNDGGPASYSFDDVNHFVHCEDAQYEDLQNLCLSLAAKHEKQRESLRDKFAGQAMSSLVAVIPQESTLVAAAAYQMADAMLEARNK